ncbi:hypothetical protein ACFSSC_08125 [Corynebacterium mendelii]|uniref:VCBS repeat-containing protein n=1 Tax=Corynebacterium mendelii TaxID=2765362 RepID=A0A939E1G3_9CORY|nr:hypothetical protein [Corynebacterium mendelii]MBN9644700.1 hypothetical protein [Corynebacterium mendelii]
MSQRFSAAVLAVVAVPVLLAGCGREEGVSARNTVTVTEVVDAETGQDDAGTTPEPETVTVTEEPQAHPMTLEDIYNAKVPAMCMHEAGTLVNGELLGIPEGHGMQQLDTTVPYAIGDFTGDGVDDIVVQFVCNAGGVSWPNQIVAYSDNEPLGLLDVHSAGINPARGPQTGLEITGAGTIRVTGGAITSQDPACCPTGDYMAEFAYGNGQFTVLATSGNYS